MAAERLVHASGHWLVYEHADGRSLPFTVWRDGIVISFCATKEDALIRIAASRLN